jgi:hypothetical protein
MADGRQGELSDDQKTPAALSMTGSRKARLSFALAALLMLVACPAFASAVPPAMSAEAALEAIDTCLNRLHPDIDIGYDRIASRCPQLARRLEESGWSRWLPRDWKRSGNDLSAGGLRELRELLSVESGSPRVTVRRPDIARLPATLAGLTPTGSVGDGWWPRAKEWLREVFERRAQDSDDDWLLRLIGRNGLPQTVIELTSYAALMLVVALAGVIVLNELRISGIAGRLRASPRSVRRARPSVEAECDGLSWDAVQRAPLVQRPRMLLEIIVAKLVLESRLPQVRGLTVRELARAARLADEKGHQGLTELAHISERVRFSAAPVPNEELAAAVEHGRTLLDQLSPGAPRGPS